MAEALLVEVRVAQGPAGRALEHVCRAWAVSGGVVLLAMAGMSLTSIAGRIFVGRPILGDYELVQVMSAIAVSMMLPYCQLARGHVIVDFFTSGAPRAVVDGLDFVASILLAGAGFVLCWCVFDGMLDLRRTGDASMLLGFKTWLAYLPMVPSFFLLGCAALFTARGPAGGAAS